MGDIWNWLFVGGGASLLLYVFLSHKSAGPLAGGVSSVLTPLSTAPKSRILDLPTGSSQPLVQPANDSGLSRGGETQRTPTSAEAFESWIIVQRYLRSIGVDEDSIKEHRCDLAPLIMQEVSDGE